MIPDKIYVKEFDEGISQIWSSIKATETTAHTQHEYIRADALLEKLNRARELRIKAGAKEQSEGIRVIDELTDLINKL